MYEPPSEQGVDTMGYDATNKGSRSAGTTGMQIQTDHGTTTGSPTTHAHGPASLEVHIFGNSTLVVQQLAFWGGSVEFTVPRDFFYRLSGMQASQKFKCKVNLHSSETQNYAATLKYRPKISHTVSNLRPLNKIF